MYRRLSAVPVDRHGGLRIRDLEIARDVDQVGQLLELRQEPRRVIVQRGVRALQRELIQALGAPAADLDGRRILQEHLDARNAGELAVEIADQLVHAHVALGAGLELHEDAPLVDLAATQERHHGVDVGVLLQHGHHLLLMAHQVVE